MTNLRFFENKFVIFNTDIIQVLPIILVIVLTKAAPALVIKWSGEYFLKWNNRLFLPFLNQSGNFRTKTFHYTQCIH